MPEAKGRLNQRTEVQRRKQQALTAFRSVTTRPGLQLSKVKEGLEFCWLVCLSVTKIGQHFNVAVSQYRVLLGLFTQVVDEFGGQFILLHEPKARADSAAEWVHTAWWNAGANNSKTGAKTGVILVKGRIRWPVATGGGEPLRPQISNIFSKRRLRFTMLTSTWEYVVWINHWNPAWRVTLALKSDKKSVYTSAYTGNTDTI